MSNIKHTPEPWRFKEFPSNDQCFIQADRNKATDPYDIEVMGDDTNEKYYPYEQKKSDALRIVSCINACAGMEDPAKEIEELKEQVKMFQHAFNVTEREKQAVTKQRDELKKVLEYVMDRIKNSEEWWMDSPNKGGFDTEKIEQALNNCK